jgi:hypothetical protein
MDGLGFALQSVNFVYFVQRTQIFRSLAFIAVFINFFGMCFNIALH